MNNKEFERYTDYKDSGVEWLGDVPEHWALDRLKNLTKTQSGTTPQSGLSEYYDNGVAYWVRTTDLNNGHLYKSEYQISELALKNYGLKTIPVNSVLLAMYGGMGTIGKNALLKVETTINQSVCAVLPNIKRFNSIYFWYYVQYFRPYWEIFADSARKDPNINQEAIKRLWLILPKPIEQQAIADYLDNKTSHIDRKIDLLTQKASLYSNLKQSLINETVTRGLDKTVPMKNSGVEWIGEIPAHWEIKRIADIAIQNKIKNSGLIEKNLLSLSYGRIIRKDFNTSFGLLPESFETYQIVKTGSIILRLTDLQNDQKSLRVGLVREKGIITAAYLGLCFHRSINPIFAYYLLHVYDLCKVFYWFGGGLRSTMHFDDIKVIPFVLPPTIEEQQAIANYLDKKTAHIDRIIETINAQITKLKELRKTLINDIVTGKIKVINLESHKDILTERFIQENVEWGLNNQE